MQKLKRFIPVVLLSAPGLAFAVSDFESLKGLIITILNGVTILLLAFAVVFFLAGVVKYIAAGADEEKRKESRNTIVYGIIGLFVMVSVWGLVGLVKNTLNLDDSAFSPPELLN